MAMIINIITLFACMATMAYCYVLAKRIHAFHNIKDGVGAVIEEMIRTTGDLQTTFTQTRFEIENQSNKLQDKIDEGVALSEYIHQILEEIQQNTHIIEQSQKNHSNVTFSQQINKKEKHATETAPETAHDLLEDVVPADFDQIRNIKRKPQVIVPGEEYI